MNDIDILKHIILSFVVRDANTLLELFQEYSLAGEKQKLVTASHKLFQEQFIIARRPAPEPTILEQFIPIPEEIEAHLNDDFHFLYKLSSKGGVLWEKWSHPNWEHYFLWLHGLTNKKGKLAVKLTCADKNLASELMNNSVYAGIGNYILGSEKWETFSPWRATYWKILPKAYRVRYLATPTSNPLWEWEQSEDEIQARKWYSEVCKWYTAPEL